MPSSSVPDLLCELADVMRASAPKNPNAALRAFVRDAERVGALVEQQDGRIVIRFPGETVLELSLAVSEGDHGGSSSLVDLPDATSALSRTEWAAAFATAVNSGVLTREIDAAMDWDPDFAV